MSYQKCIKCGGIVTTTELDKEMRCRNLTCDYNEVQNVEMALNPNSPNGELHHGVKYEVESLREMYINEGGVQNKWNRVVEYVENINTPIGELIIATEIINHNKTITKDFKVKTLKYARELLLQYGGTNLKENVVEKAVEVVEKVTNSGAIQAADSVAILDAIDHMNTRMDKMGKVFNEMLKNMNMLQQDSHNLYNITEHITKQITHSSKQVYDEVQRTSAHNVNQRLEAEIKALKTKINKASGAVYTASQVASYINTKGISATTINNAALTEKLFTKVDNKWWLTAKGVNSQYFTYTETDVAGVKRYGNIKFTKAAVEYFKGLLT